MTQTSTSVPKELKLAEAELLNLSGRIDPVLRKHFANRVLRKLLVPTKNASEASKHVVLWMPSGISIAVGFVGFFFAYSLLSSLKFLPLTDWIAFAIGIAVAWQVEHKLLPKIYFSGYRFRLMRLEGYIKNSDYPDEYISAPHSDAPSGFKKVYWKLVDRVEIGYLLVSVYDRQDNGVAILHLRTEGRLAISSWRRDLFQPDVLPPLSGEVKQLAHEFDAACDKYLAVAQKIESSRALKSSKDVPQQRNPEAVWQGVVIAPDVKTRLMSLAKHFSDGSAAASRGLLLYGPPGTGKTLIAKKLAESMGCAFFPLSLPDLKAGHIGQSGERVKELWQRALAQPRSVVFVDECEGVFGRRGGVESDSFTAEIVTAFLAQWDGFTKQTTVWVVGATNRRDLIDPAILSRFGEEVEIGLPNEQQRVDILRNEMGRKGISSGLPAEAGELTQGMAGRDLESLAGRLAREQAGTVISAEVLARYTEAFRKQGSSKTDGNAKWENLILSDAVLKELKNTAGLLLHAEAFSKRGINIPKGMLLYGPPGTGKTQIARTLANETGLRFIAASTADMKAGFIGQSGQKVRELFERARDSAPCLLFLDELDIVAPARGSANDSDQFTKEIIGQLLQEMDGVRPNTQPVFVLAASNRIDQIDSAILSRFQKRIEIPTPDMAGRQQLLQVMLSTKPTSFDIGEAAKHLADLTSGMSGRDLRNWIEQAEQNAVGRALEQGNPEAAIILLEDFPVPQPA